MGAFLLAANRAYFMLFSILETGVEIMRLWIALTTILALGGPAAYADDYDLLARQNLQLAGTNAASTIDQVLSNLTSRFGRFHPQLASDTRIVSPVRIAGGAGHPIVQMTVMKCVFTVCHTVDFDGELSVREVAGRCQRNLVIEANLAHSGESIREVYDSFEIDMCMNQSAGGIANLIVIAQAHRAGTYQPGLIQQVVLQFLRLQVPPMVLAFNGDMS
jgi:hypothetical protein